MARKIERYGWIPDIPDARDHLYAAPPSIVGRLPSRITLRPKCPTVYDQEELGSCTANAIAAAIEFDQMKQGRKRHFTPSRLFIYYNERVMEGTVDIDSGAMIRDGIKSVGKQGACPERNWPYKIETFRDRPSRECYRVAKKHKAILYQRLQQTLNQLKGCVASGFPFIFGFTVYESFEAPAVTRSGHAPMPGPREKVLGGHAVLGVGYDESKQWFICRNSWGTGWGMSGYFTLPYAYLTDHGLASDFWTIRLVK
jgi:C1A family cysteine protease